MRELSWILEITSDPVMDIDVVYWILVFYVALQSNYWKKKIPKPCAVHQWPKKNSMLNGISISGCSLSHIH